MTLEEAASDFFCSITLREWDSPLGQLVRRFMDAESTFTDVRWFLTLAQIYELPEVTA